MRVIVLFVMVPVVLKFYIKSYFIYEKSILIFFTKIDFNDNGLCVCVSLFVVVLIVLLVFCG